MRITPFDSVLQYDFLIEVILTVIPCYFESLCTLKNSLVRAVFIAECLNLNNPSNNMLKEHLVYMEGNHRQN